MEKCVNCHSVVLAKLRSNFDDNRKENSIMSGSTFGNIFKITTWGESHGPGIGVVVDGCPAGLALNEIDIHHFLIGENLVPLVLQRKERNPIALKSSQASLKEKQLAHPSPCLFAILPKDPRTTMKLPPTIAPGTQTIPLTKSTASEIIGEADALLPGKPSAEWLQALSPQNY